MFPLNDPCVTILQLSLSFDLLSQRPTNSHDSHTARTDSYPSFGWSHCARVPILIWEGPHRQEEPRTTRVTLRFQGPPLEFIRPKVAIILKLVRGVFWCRNPRLHQQWVCIRDIAMQSFSEEPSQVFSVICNLPTHFCTQTIFVFLLSSEHKDF